MTKTQCPICGKGFRGMVGVRAHAQSVHRKHYVWPDGKAVLRRDIPDDEPSMADRMIEAQLQHAMGGPVDENWLLDASA